jgi:hypothetical protein
VRYMKTQVIPNQENPSYVSLTKDRHGYLATLSQWVTYNSEPMYDVTSSVGWREKRFHKAMDMARDWAKRLGVEFREPTREWPDLR